MAKIKMKTKKAFAKRILQTGTGKLKRKHAFRSHLATSKTSKQKRQLRGYAILNKPQMKRAAHLLQK